jgi:hypothetical protein
LQWSRLHRPLVRRYIHDAELFHDNAASKLGG